MFRPSASKQMTTPIQLLKANSERINGVLVKTYTPGSVLMCNWKSYGGTEKIVNDVIAVEDTAQVVCWYEPEIESADAVRLLTTGADYSIMGEPENIEMRNQFLSFKVTRIKGGA